MENEMRSGEQIGAAWQKINAYWQDESAKSYYEEYLVPMYQSAESFDIALSKVSDQTAKLRERVDDIRRQNAIL